MTQASGVWSRRRHVTYQLGSPSSSLYEWSWIVFWGQFPFLSFPFHVCSRISLQYQYTCNTHWFTDWLAHELTDCMVDSLTHSLLLSHFLPLVRFHSLSLPSLSPLSPLSPLSLSPLSLPLSPPSLPPISLAICLISPVCPLSLSLFIDLTLTVAQVDIVTTGCHSYPRLLWQPTLIW